MNEVVCLTEQQILNANGRVVRDPDGTISVFTVSPATGLLAPQFLTKSCCDSLNISGAYWDADTQKCRWSSATCGFGTPFNLVLNPKGNDGTIFVATPDETCTLSVDFDYLFKFDCDTLTALANGTVTGSCPTIVNAFESLGASMVVDVVGIAQSNTFLSSVYEETFFETIGNGNLYNYLSVKSGDTGFFICGKLTNNLTDTDCHALDLYNLNITGDTLNCITPVNQIIQQLFNESGLPVSATTTFQQNVASDAFAANWQHFHTEITDPTIISAITNEKIKLTIKLSGTCIDTCVLVDNIRMDKNCVKVSRNDIFITQSPGFELDRIRDNKKSWIANTSNTHRTFNITKLDGSQPIRFTDYYLDNENQTINTKEIDLDINIAAAVETDVWSYILDNPCILTGLSVGTTTCVKDAFVQISAGTVVTGITLSTTTINVSAVTSVTYFCPVGYSATPANDDCQKITTTAATFNGSGATIVAGNVDNTYGDYGTRFLPSIQNNGALPVFYPFFTGLIQDQTGGTITPIVTNMSNSFWYNSGNTVDGRLNHIGLSASSTEFLGFSKCVDIPSGGTYYIGIGADNLAKFTVNGVLVVYFSGSVGDNFRAWNVFPFHLNSGKNIIEMYGENTGGNTAFGAEIYNPIDFATLTGATGTGSSQANVIFSTKEFIGKHWDLGTTAGYTCPVGYALDNCGTAFTCTLIQNAAITGVTGYSVTTATTTTTGHTFSTATTVSGICMPMTYCCSNFCGDVPIDLNSLLTQPLSALTTIEDFEYFITSELIDAKDRKIISSYPTLRLLYDRYLNSRIYCNTNSSKFDYFTMDKFAGLIGNYWVDIIEQVIPATTIWGSTKIYTNTIFDIEKFKYKAYTTLFGNNIFGDIKVLSPTTGMTCNTSATTTVIQGSSTGTTLFFNQGDIHNYSSVYLIQMNSSSEFIGSVNIIGPAGTTTTSSTGTVIVINECGLQVHVTSTNPDYLQANGTMMANVTGNNGAVTYLWSNGATTQTINNLTGGTYSVIVTDTSTDNCTANASATISQNTCSINLVITTFSSVHNGNTGSANVSASTGQAPYTYSWNTTPVQTGTTATGLTAGTYVITVTDFNGCQVTGNAIINNLPCNLSLLITGSTSGGTFGAIASNGVGPYTYVWYITGTTGNPGCNGVINGTYNFTNATTQTFPLDFSNATNGATITGTFDANTRPDRFNITQNGSTIVSSGWRGSDNTYFGPWGSPGSLGSPNGSISFTNLTGDSYALVVDVGPANPSNILNDSWSTSFNCSATGTPTTTLLVPFFTGSTVPATGGTYYVVATDAVGCQISGSTTSGSTFELFSMSADSINSITFGTVASTSLPYFVDWGDGTISGYTAGSHAPTHTYSSPYTGFIVLRSNDLSDINNLTISLSITPSVNSPVYYPMVITANELGKLDGVSYLQFDAPFISGNVNQLPRNPTSMYINWNSLSGNTIDLPRLLQNMNLRFFTTISGLTNNLPSGLTNTTITGNNTIGGPTSGFPTGLTHLEIAGNNIVSGNTTGFPTGLTFLSIAGNNTVSGLTTGLSRGMTNLTMTGFNRLSGDTSGLPTGLTQVYIDGLNGVSGSTSGLSRTLTSLTLLGNNLLSGPTSGFPSTLTFCDVIGNNTISGNTSGFPSNLTSIDIEGNNTISGGTGTFPPLLTNLRIKGLNTISGDLASIPTGITSVQIYGNSNIHTYATGRTWNSNVSMSLIDINPLTLSGFTNSNQVDGLFIDLTGVTTWNGEQAIKLIATATTASLAARTYLASSPRNVTITLT